MDANKSTVSKAHNLPDRRLTNEDRMKGTRASRLLARQKNLALQAVREGNLESTLIVPVVSEDTLDRCERAKLPVDSAIYHSPSPRTVAKLAYSLAIGLWKDESGQQIEGLRLLTRLIQADGQVAAAKEGAKGIQQLAQAVLAAAQGRERVLPAQYKVLTKRADSEIPPLKLSSKKRPAKQPAVVKERVDTSARDAEEIARALMAEQLGEDV